MNYQIIVLKLNDMKIVKFEKFNSKDFEEMNIKDIKISRNNFKFKKDFTKKRRILLYKMYILYNLR